MYTPVRITGTVLDFKKRTTRKPQQSERDAFSLLSGCQVIKMYNSLTGINGVSGRVTYPLLNPCFPRIIPVCVHLSDLVAVCAVNKRCWVLCVGLPGCTPPLTPPPSAPLPHTPPAAALQLSSKEFHTARHALTVDRAPRQTREI